MTAALQDVFQFMAIRAGEKLDKYKSRKGFIRDDAFYCREGSQIEHDLHDLDSSSTAALSGLHGIFEVDIFSGQSNSPVGKLVYKHLIGSNPKSATGNIRKRSNVKRSGPKSIEDKVEELMVEGFSYGPDDQIRTPPLIRTLKLDQNLSVADGFFLSYSSEKNTYKNGNSLLIFPDSLNDIYTPLTKDLIAVLKAVDDFVAQFKASKQAPVFDFNNLLSKLKKSLTNSSDSVSDVVFNPQTGEYEGDFAYSKRVLFDTLYGLYILRKKYTLSLEPVIDGLRACHLLEYVAITEFFYNAISNKSYPTNSTKLVSVLSEVFPLLAKWEPDASNALATLKNTGIPLISSIEDIVELTQLSPIINPIFARLGYTFEPFNSIKPIGIGDLKVVKQKFIGYKKGEIAHIETVLAGETKTRVHRVLEKSEDSFSLSSSSDSESTKDSQSTSRFELKNETEDTIKSDLGVNANANFTYKGNPVIDATVTAGMTYVNSKTTSDKSSQNFVNEVISKATSRIQSKVSQQRSQIRQLETEETHTHTFTNTPPKDNISGIYLWLEKVYEAQIHNFGKRLMFEFILPEPAEFYVESKLYSNAVGFDLPKYPERISSGYSSAGVVNLSVKKAEDITEDLFNNELSKSYNLDDLKPPVASIEGFQVVNGKGLNFTKTSAYNRFGLKKEIYRSCSINGGIPAGYFLSGIRVTGRVEFANRDESQPNDQNTLQIFISDSLVFDKVDEQLMYWNLDETSVLPIPSLNKDDFDLTIGTKTCVTHTLQFYFSFSRTQETFSKWQRDVFERIQTSQPKLINSDASASDQDFQTKLIEYQKKLNEVKASVLNEAIQGKSSLWNQDAINCELKRQCISMIAKEFDADRSDDIVSKFEATKKIGLDVYFPTLNVVPGHPKNGGATEIVEANANYIDKKDEPFSTFSLPDLEVSKRKGKYIQFLEQAFEWNQLSYIFYPYFWASTPKWIELMSRDDASDPLFTKFLQAGSSKVLLAVTPGYENAVLHFLATREPWEGGPAPVIGDPLYIPLYEEVRSQQDDLAGSTPVGEPWEFTLPTSLIYLQSDQHKLVNEYQVKTP